MGAMVQEQERGLGGWQAEWGVLPDLFLLASGCQRCDVTPCCLKVSRSTKQRIAENLRLEAGLSMAEAATFCAGECRSPEPRAKEMVELAIKTCAPVRLACHLTRRLMSIDEIAQGIGQSTLDSMLDPASYLGSSC